ncbi:hypothetical protein PR002_g21703 [Phytophthora rubi]|uniref:Uncharacterized protein n=1 Tax=Phytophthora rubi TaxID=129364 RepID=A0A6A3J060_9STRA|nr:hypothetical protein PR002_g21703 [Phytophthora rubi]
MSPVIPFTSVYNCSLQSRGASPLNTLDTSSGVEDAADALRLIILLLRARDRVEEDDMAISPSPRPGADAPSAVGDGTSGESPTRPSSLHETQGEVRSTLLAASGVRPMGRDEKSPGDKRPKSDGVRAIPLARSEPSSECRDEPPPGVTRPVFSGVRAAPQTSSEHRSGPADVCDVEPTSGKTAPTSVVFIISDTPTSSTETDSVQCSRQ